MRILMSEAGAVGSLYAALLAQSGNDVALLAQGQRLCYLRKNGLRYQIQGQENSIGVRILDKLRPEDRYDYIFVAHGGEELPGGRKALEENDSPTLVLLSSGVKPWAGWEELAQRGRVITLIPGLEGELENGVAKGRILPGWFQPTLLGEWKGADTFRVRKLKKLLRKAKIPCRISPDVGEWQARRLALLLPAAEACRAEKDRQGAGVRQAAGHMKGNLNRLEKRGISLSWRGRFLNRLPEGVLTWGLRAYSRRSRRGRFLCRWAERNRDTIEVQSRELAEYLAAGSRNKE